MRKRRADFLSKLQGVSRKGIDSRNSEVFIEEELLPQQAAQLEQRLIKRCIRVDRGPQGG